MSEETKTKGLDDLTEEEQKKIMEVTSHEMLAEKNKLGKWGSGDTFRHISHMTIDNWITAKENKRFYAMNDRIEELSEICQSLIYFIMEKPDVLEYYIQIKKVYAHENDGKEMPFIDALRILLNHKLGEKDIFKPNYTRE